MSHGSLTMSFRQTSNEAYEEDDGRTWREVTYESDSSPKIVVRYGGYDNELDWAWRTVVGPGRYMEFGDMRIPRPCPMVCDTLAMAEGYAHKESKT